MKRATFNWSKTNQSKTISLVFNFWCPRIIYLSLQMHAGLSYIIIFANSALAFQLFVSACSATKRLLKSLVKNYDFNLLERNYSVKFVRWCFCLLAARRIKFSRISSRRDSLPLALFHVDCALAKERKKWNQRKRKL